MSGFVSTTQAPTAPEATGLGLTEHDKAMIAKVDGGAPAPTSTESATKSTEQAPADAAKTNDGSPKATELPPTETTPEALSEAAKVAAEAAKAAGGDTSKVDFNALSAEYAQSGAISAESYAKLEASGLSKDIVDQFIEGQAAIADKQIAEAYALVGGKEQYAVMSDWASKSLPAAELAAFDKAVVGDAATRSMALTALRARYEAAVGKDPVLIRPGAGSGNSSAGAYQSRAEVTADMRSPKYRNDPAFRAEVERKLSISNVF